VYSVIQILFIVIAVVGLLAAIGTVLARNLIHAALYLIGFFFVTACTFVILEAEFLAAIQVLVYIGAVSILLMFGIMLTRNIQGDDTTTIPKGMLVPALAATLGLFFVLMFGINNHVGLRKPGPRQNPQTKERAPVEYSPGWVNVTKRPPARGKTVEEMGRMVGQEMTTRYMIGFEVAGLLLTAALVGAVALAHREAEDEVSARPVPGAIGRAATARAGSAGTPDVNGSAPGSGPEHSSTPPIASQA
jgi:NADH:ubiquinone oxidoreductase subunit 6 (subunit J)